MKKILFVAGTALLLAACSDSSGAVKALDGAGYTEIETLGWSPWGGCSDDDFYVTKFRAKGPTGKNVSGVVCSGFWFKGSTIRTQ